MQDKTQLFPLAKSDYVRTRLTHSLEVSSVGRTLGVLAADIIHRKDAALKDIVIPGQVGTIVATACLAHDIGNPPFGHAGEAAIQEWFEVSNAIKNGDMPSSKQQDFLKFEGNANGFRRLCVLQNYPQNGGLQLTSSVLGSMTKYPRESSVSENQENGISGKKFGFMQSEVNLFKELANELGLIKKEGDALAWHRHPLAFLVEAADDICYHVMDIEDGFRANVISYDELQWLHKPWLTNEQLQRANSIKGPKRRAGYLRSMTIDKMIEQMMNAFKANYDGIMSGSFDKELSSCIPCSTEFAEFKRTAKEKIYCSDPVAEVEACGFEVIAGLLSAFVEAIEIKVKKISTKNARSKTLLHLLPDDDGRINELLPDQRYERLLVATDFVSGMTDSYAVNLYQRISGISLP
jgi:dGTPase